MEFPYPRVVGLSLVVRVVRGGQFLSLREAYILNLSLLGSLEPFEKFVVVVVVGGGGWWCVNPF